MMLLRGKGQGLEIGCRDRDLSGVCEDLRATLAAQPDFYRGSRARATFDSVLPSESEIAPLRALLAEYGIALDDVVLVEAVPDDAAARRVASEEAKPLSESARSLVADFAGARADLAERRIKRARTGAPRAERIAAAGQPELLGAESGTLYHRGTLRGGQALHHLGNIVVVGDVNPGAELVASGDIVVFGALRGVAHAGAQGDATARVVALELAPTQLRIATVIAAADESHPPGRVAEHAIVRDGSIVILPHDQAEHVHREVVN
jgi:septum site-determining protein MinC